MLLDDLAGYITSQTTAFTLGTDFFKGNIPPTSAGTCAGIYEEGGRRPQWGLGGSSPIYEEVVVQVLTRSTKYTTARNNCETIYTILDRLSNSTTISSSGPRYVKIAALESPHYIGPDEMNRPTIAARFEVWKELS